MLIRELPDIEFSLLAVADSPLAKLQFELPPNLVDFRALPLWGLRHAWEFDRTADGRSAHARRRRTTEAAVAAGFVPTYRVLVRQLLGGRRDDDALAQALLSAYRFFSEYDFDRTFRSRAVWDAFGAEVAAGYPALVASLGYADSGVSLAELAAGSQWLYHWLLPLAQPLPDVDVAHATMAGLCSLVALVSKLDRGSGFLLSEHGIYLRECYLAEHSSSNSLFAKVFKLAFARRMTEVAYAYADAVAPCCDYNHRWESRIGVETDRLRTAYYGVDAEMTRGDESGRSEAPVVAWAGRIDPLKDVETLLRAAAVVHEARPEVRFRLYGAAPPGNELYQKRCLDLHAKLGLEEAVRFEGFSPNVLDAFAEADLVVLSSISEGFPFSTLEAMLCGKPVVATGVGGIAEQVTADCGRVVRPRDPKALGGAILDVLSSPETCQALSRAARDRAVSLFGMERFRATHREIYELVLPEQAPRRAPRTASTPAVAATAPSAGAPAPGAAAPLFAGARAGATVVSA
jgi:glycosyltransferase involved in cell wall biosynthesis